MIFVCTYRKKLLTLYEDEAKKLFEGSVAPSDFSFGTMETRIIFTDGSKSEPRISPIGNGAQETARSDYSALARARTYIEKAFLEGKDILE
jgi:hypothetical protein